MLKGQPAVKKRTNNFDACRDLSGRRLRHVNQEKMLHDWYQKKIEEERMINEFNNAGEVNDIDHIVRDSHRLELSEMNKKFDKEINESENSIKNSFKYMLKTKRKSELKVFEKPIINKKQKKVNSKMDEASNNNIPSYDYKIGSVEHLNKEDLEKELLALDD